MGMSKVDRLVEGLASGRLLKGIECRNFKGGEYGQIPVFEGVFWSTKQRAGNALHEVPYRASFKPALPEFFIGHLSQRGQTVLDPFSGRGTTALAAAMLGRRAIAADVNPLSNVLLAPRLVPPQQNDVVDAVEGTSFAEVPVAADDPLLAFFHARTLSELRAWQIFLRKSSPMNDWLRMVITTRLTGHSRGFFSAYTLPPNQAVTTSRQRRINESRGQKPEYRPTKPRIIAKSRALLRNVTAATRGEMRKCNHIVETGVARCLVSLDDESVDLVVTSPPFLNVVDYKADNWLRCWFNDIDLGGFEISTPSTLCGWQKFIEAALREMRRVLRPDGVIAIEVGDVMGGSDSLVVAILNEIGSADLACRALIVNGHAFSKTSQCWGVRANALGTNSNRVLLLTRADSLNDGVS